MTYKRKFYEDQIEGSLRSAEEVVPVIIDMVKPRSVVDVGCGVGTWLSVFLKHGVEDVLGLDGSHVPTDMLMIPAEKFRAVDLRSDWGLERRFDVAMSLEVAEHLPPDAAPAHVAALTRLAPVVVFAAAVPFQGGTDHVNEQWPRYWLDLFKQQGFVAVDAIRPRIWDNRKVEAFYRQDLLVYVRRDAFEPYPQLAVARLRTHENMLSIVHPVIYTGRDQYPLAPVPHLLMWTLRLGAGRMKQRVRDLFAKLAKKIKG